MLVEVPALISGLLATPASNRYVNQASNQWRASHPHTCCSLRISLRIPSRLPPGEVFPAG
ncbi:hypothetical protein CBM2586_B10197 [Cupriavidus phytorum]|uniref:Uncharacterized protein n=1 Tax=Cupriavidus taiwanensis TaxID=164546 RepID=A0A375C924_9BURK|nr:hypothetical protein CBM2586_B10197 [Cupriavidus taiwanensis]